MKKINSFIFLVLAFVLFCSPLNVSAAEVAEELMPTLDYDATSQRLSGQTVPNANLSFSAFVADIVADEEGKFELPIPADIKQSQIRIDDYLNNLYLELDFDFTTGTLATTVETSTTQMNQNTNSSKGNSSKSNASIKEKPSPTPAKSTDSKGSLLILWVLLLVLIVGGTVGGLLYAQRKKEQKKSTQKKRRSRKKGKRRKKRKASRK